MSYLTLADGITPATPAAAKTRLYTNAGRVADVTGAGADRYLGSTPWNLLRNSGFWFKQRGDTFNIGGTFGNRIMCGADGWALSQYGNNSQYTRGDTGSSAREVGNLRSRYYGRILRNVTGAGRVCFTQVIDASEVEAVRGHYVRLSFKLRSVNANLITLVRAGILAWNGTVDAMGAGLYNNVNPGDNCDPNWATNYAPIAPARDGLNCPRFGFGYSCPVTQQWQQYSGVFFVPTTAKNLAVNFFTVIDGTAQTTQFAIADAMLTDGEQYYDFFHQGIANEFLRVARFYQKSHPVDSGAGQALGANTGEFHFASVVGASAAFAGVGIRFPVRMYQTPTTLTLFNPAAANGEVRNVTLGTDCTTSAITADNETGAWINSTTPASTAAGNNMAVHWSADAEL